jgi:hypothetical protein
MISIVGIALGGFLLVRCLRDEYRGVTGGRSSYRGGSIPPVTQAESPEMFRQMMSVRWVTGSVFFFSGALGLGLSRKLG